MSDASSNQSSARPRQADVARGQSGLKRWVANDRGNVAILSALCMTIAIGLAGAALDFGRAYTARTQTQKALDAAVLAAGRVLQTTQSESEALAIAQKYYDQSKSKLLASNNVAFTIENNKTLISATAIGSVDTFILGVFKYDNLDVSVASRSEMAGGSNSGTNYEISMMLDVTGSMCDDGVGPCTNGAKLDALKAAATDLVNIAIWDSQSTYTARAAVVPFATRIRVGPNAGGGPIMKRLTDLDETWSGWYNICTSGGGSGGSETGGNWYCTKYKPTYLSNLPIMPCVTDRTGPHEFTDANPGPNAWLDAHDGTRMAKSWDSADIAPPNRIGQGENRSGLSLELRTGW